MIRRHSFAAILMHWGNAVCWLFLLFSGFALLANPLTQPVGQWWVTLWDSLLGGALSLLNAHVVIGVVWLILSFVYIVARCRAEVVPFLHEITDLHPAEDMIWCARKGLRLTVGEAAMRRFGLNTALPPQGFYNAGQKLAAVAAVLCSVGLAATGCMMLFTAGSSGMQGLLQWSLFIHFCCAGIMAIVLPIHIYMAALAPGEGPALRSMFTGWVPEAFVKHHNPLWLKEIQAKAKADHSQTACSGGVDRG